MIKLAVIGSGATGHVAAHAISETPGSFDLHVFHGAPAPARHRLEGVDHEHWSRDDLAALHESIRRQVGRKFPPPKSHFGETIPRHDATAGRTFWRSLVPGGLTRYWSASLLPFTAEELAQWGFDRGEFDEHYGNVAAQIGLAAREDGLNRYFGRSFATRPPITPTPLIEKLIGAIEGARDARPVAAGINRVAIETRSGHARQCVSCGACFYGCPRHSVFSGAEAGAPRSDRMRITNVPEKVLYARHVSAGYELETPSGRHGPFDRVFCAAGCIGSAELVARSFLERAVAELVDNELFVFPLLYLGRGQRPHDGYVAIANALVGLLPDGGGERYAEAHVAPIPDLLTRFYLPAALDRTAVRLARWLRGRSLLVKLYLHSETAPRFKVVPSPTDVRIEKTADGKGTPKLARLLERLRGALGGSGFWMPRGLPVLRSKTSSHYAGGFEPAAVHAADAATGEVAPRFHVLDSSLMPFSPAQPLTFTSMANARRIVRSVLGA